MNVLSLFDGMSCGQIALERAGIKVDNYFASEVDKYAIKVTQANYPNTIQLGDVTNNCFWDIPEIDLIMGGSPCQGFSFAGKQLNFDDPRSKLFFSYVECLKTLKSRYFLLENVKMKKEIQDAISEILGVEPIKINSSLVSAQNRVRLYWTNIPGVCQPEDKGMLLKDILEEGIVDRDKSRCIISSIGRTTEREYFKKHQGQMVYERPHGFNNGGITNRDKFATLRFATAHNYELKDKEGWRKITPIECERLQTVPDNYTNHASNSQRYKMLGNGWTVDVIAHILKGLNE